MMDGWLFVHLYRLSLSLEWTNQWVSRCHRSLSNSPYASTGTRILTSSG